MANPKYTIKYFNVKALAEPIRMLFAYGNIEFEDVRYNQEEFLKIKPTLPMGQMPLLIIDGKCVFHQSIAMTRYVAKLVGLAGADAMEDLQIDIAVDTINDFRAKIAVVHYEADEAVKTKKRVTLVAETIPFYLDKLEALAKENNQHFALGKLTWADVYFAGLIDYINYMNGGDSLEKHPNLKAIVKNVNELNGIKEWIARRPVTEL